jgi:soluble lytic murein transglycosylase
MAPNDFRESPGSGRQYDAASSQHRHDCARLSFRQFYQRNTLATDAIRPGGWLPVTKGNRTALVGALFGSVLALALVPIAPSYAQTKPDDKTDAKIDAKTHKPNAKPEAKPEQKAEKKKPEKKAERKPDKPADTHAANKKSPAEKKAATARADNPKNPKPHPALAATRNIELSPRHASTAARLEPAAAPFAHALPPTAGIALVEATTAATPAADIDAVRQAIGFVRNRRIEEATAVARGISDPLARKLVEWVILRSDDNNIDFARYSAFIAANPGWPSIVTLRRRAEAMLWQERAGSATVRAYFADGKPLSPKGRFALARALLNDGDSAGAQAYAREAWRLDAFSQELEAQAHEIFGSLITRADDKARMDRSLYVTEDLDAGLRAARRLGGDEPAIAKARIAVMANAHNAKAQLDAVPAAARRDAGYVFARIRWLRQHDKIADAGALMLTAPRDPALLRDTDEWWIERRLLARKLLDAGDARTAYAVVRDAATPAKDNYRAEHEFTAGWIALRFLHETALAAKHFARVAEGNANPITISRAGYWLGRTSEAANRPQEARAYYEVAARYSTAYYGQLARARLGHGELAFAAAPAPSGERAAAVARLEVVRAAELLYAVGERDFVAPFVADLADKSTDQAALAMLAQIAEKNGDARAILLIGKIALGRGFPFDEYAFPVGGLPRYSAIGPAVEPAVVYAIARQESAFNPKTVSSAKALGLMQVTPDAGRYIAKKFGVSFDQHRLLHDTVYNMQMGAAELGDDIARYRGSYILAFAGYNAGAGRVKEWIERYGDPRDPRVDPVDWVERIPFSETRNYVERILENLQVYRVRFGGGSKLMIEADLHRGGAPTD